MLRHAIIDKNGMVKNVVIWDGITPWNPPEGHIAVQHDTVNIGDTYDHEIKIINKTIIIASDHIDAQIPSLEDIQKQLNDIQGKLGVNNV